MLYMLEDRVYFDGAAASDANKTATTTSDNANAAPDTDNSSNASHIIASVVGDSATASASSTEKSAEAKVYFIDASVKDASSIVAQLSGNATIVHLTKGGDGVAEITDYLASHANISSISIITHGNDGRIELGADALDASSLASEYAVQVASWGKSLTSDGDIKIYSCMTASTDAGKAFVNEIATLTSADVAASTNATGVDGDWTLEYSVGKVADTTLHVSNYSHDLVDVASWSELASAIDGKLTDITLSADLSTSSTIAIGHSVSIDGGAHTISNGGAATYFEITTSGAKVTLSNMTITGATDSAIVMDSGTALSLSSVILSDNSTTDDGGAISASNASSLEISNSTFSGNHADDAGGALYVANGTLTISSTTFYDNSATKAGGALYDSSSSATTTITNSTFADNSADNGGAVYATASAKLSLSGSIFADNLGGDSSESDIHCEAIVTSGGHNIVGAATNFTAAPTDKTYTKGKDILWASGLNGDAALEDNGGSTLTIAIAAEGIAYGAGGGNPGSYADQRGYTTTNATLDAGAYQYDAIKTADAIGDYKTIDKANGNWSSASNWLVYTKDGWVAATSAPTSDAGTITITNTASITLDDSFTITSYLVVNGTLTAGSGAPLTIAGSLNGSGSLNVSKILLEDCATVDSNVSITVTTLEIVSGSFSSSSNFEVTNLTIDAGATFTLTDDLIISSANKVIVNGTLEADSFLTLAGTTAISLSGDGTINAYNLNVASASVAACNLTLSGDLTLYYSLNVTKTLTATTIVGKAATVNLTVASGTIEALSGTFGTLDLSNTTATVSGNLTATTVKLTSATLCAEDNATLTTKTLSVVTEAGIDSLTTTVTSSLAIAKSATLTFSNETLTLQNVTGITGGGALTLSDTTLSLTGSGNFAMTGVSFTADTENSLTVSRGGAKITLDSDLSLHGVDITGTPTFASTTKTAYSVTAEILVLEGAGSYNLASNRIYVADAGTLTINRGTATVIMGANTSLCELNVFGKLTLSTGKCTMSVDTLTIEDNATFNMPQALSTVGTLDIGTGATLNLSGKFTLSDATTISGTLNCGVYTLVLTSAPTIEQGGLIKVANLEIASGELTLPTSITSLTTLTIDAYASLNIGSALKVTTLSLNTAGTITSSAALTVTNLTLTGDADTSTILPSFAAGKLTAIVMNSTGSAVTNADLTVTTFTFSAAGCFAANGKLTVATVNANAAGCLYGTGSLQATTINVNANGFSIGSDGDEFSTAKIDYLNCNFAGTTNIDDSISIAKKLTLAKGTIDLGDNTLTMSAKSVIAGTATIGTGTGTLVLNDSITLPTVNVATLNVLAGTTRLSKALTITSSAQIDGTLIGGTNLLTLSEATVSGNGTITTNAIAVSNSSVACNLNITAKTVDFDGLTSCTGVLTLTGVTSITGTLSVDNLVLAGSGSFNDNGLLSSLTNLTVNRASATITMSNLAVINTLTVYNAPTLDFSDNIAISNATLASGSFKLPTFMTSLDSLTIARGALLTLQGDLELNALSNAGTLNAGNHLLSLTGLTSVGAGRVLATNLALHSCTLTLPSSLTSFTTGLCLDSSAVTLSVNTSFTSLSIDSDSSLILNGKTVTLAGDSIANSGIITADANAKILISGSGSYALGKVTALGYLQINNAGATLNLDQDLSISKNLTLSKGYIDLCDRTLAFGNSATLSGGAKTSFLYTSGFGTITKTIAKGQTFNFAVGYFENETPYYTPKSQKAATASADYIALFDSTTDTWSVTQQAAAPFAAAMICFVPKRRKNATGLLPELAGDFSAMARLAGNFAKHPSFKSGYDSLLDSFVA